jgi:hypothetical protein
MDKLSRYRELVKRLFNEWSTFINRSRDKSVETQCVFDDDHDQYLLVSLGWTNRRRVRHVLLHVRLRDGKIWVEEDGPEEDIANELLREGVPHQDNVLAFHPPEMRRPTEFASA